MVPGSKYWPKAKSVATYMETKLMAPSPANTLVRASAETGAILQFVDESGHRRKHGVESDHVLVDHTFHWLQLKTVRSSRHRHRRLQTGHRGQFTSGASLSLSEFCEGRAWSGASGTQCEVGWEPLSWGVAPGRSTVRCGRGTFVADVTDSVAGRAEVELYPNTVSKSCRSGP